MDASTVVSVAGAVVSAAGATATWWIRWRDRAQADWVVHVADVYARTGPAKVWELHCKLENCGDGTAYRVRPNGIGCRAEFRRLVDDTTSPWQWQGAWFVPSIGPGESIDLYASAPLEGVPHLSSVKVEIEWLRTPTRHRRTSVVTLDFASLRGVHLDEPGAFLALYEPWWVRRFMTEARRSARRARQLPRSPGQP